MVAATRSATRIEDGIGVPVGEAIIQQNRWVGRGGDDTGIVFLPWNQTPVWYWGLSEGLSNEDWLARFIAAQLMKRDGA